MRKECGPITDPQLHQGCLDSFAQYSPLGWERIGLRVFDGIRA